MKKLDLKVQYKYLYNPSAKAVIAVDVPNFRFLRVSGDGGPNEAYRQAVQALFAVAYALKFMVKKSATAVDYAVMPLESLWSSDDPSEFRIENKDRWKWTATIMQPEFVDEALFEEAKVQVEKKKGLPHLSEMDLASFCEGRAAQVMHIGPYAEEGPTIEAILRFISDEGGKPNGKHHEIYLSDPGKTAASKLKTVIRQPFV